MKYNRYLVLFVACILLQIKGKTTYAQTIDLPYTLNTASGSSIVNEFMFDYSFAEMVLVDTYSSGQFLLSQGFLQPYYIAIPFLTDVKARNNIITPNNDGKNDFFTVQGLGNYPGSVLSIYDRAGRLIYRATDYKNDWNGTFNGKQLFEDSYYYVIDLGKSKGLIRGFISIVRDDRQ